MVDSDFSEDGVEALGDWIGKFGVPGDWEGSNGVPEIFKDGDNIMGGWQDCIRVLEELVDRIGVLEGIGAPADVGTTSECLESWNGVLWGWGGGIGELEFLQVGDGGLENGC